MPTRPALYLKIIFKLTHYKVQLLSMFTHNNAPKKRHIIRNILLGLLLCGFIVGLGSIYMVRKWYKDNLSSLSANTEVKNITIKSGMGPGAIASMLVDEGIIRNARAFQTYVRGKQLATELKAGVYELSPSMTVQQVVDVLVSGKEASTLFTIGPGKRLDQIESRMLKAGYTQQDIDAAMQPSQYKDIAILSNLPTTKSLEGFLYPETFQVTVSSRPTDIVRQSLQQLDKAITSDMKTAFLTHNLNVFQAITLASIVEKEVPKAEDRKIVAQIFQKRLAEGIALGSDATYYYASAVYGGEPFPDLDSPYNTRIYAGLPPGPINNVSKSALEAVAYPADTDYLFFVTGDDGVNHYTRTSAEHEQATKQFCKISCATGYVPETL